MNGGGGGRCSGALLPQCKPGPCHLPLPLSPHGKLGVQHAPPNQLGRWGAKAPPSEARSTQPAAALQQPAPAQPWMSPTMMIRL